MILPILASTLSIALLGPAATDSILNNGRRATTTKGGSVLAADSIVVEKGLRRLTLYLDGKPVKHYGIALGKNPSGRKVQIGDNRTPEGTYFIEGRNLQSQYYRSLRISYPDAMDKLRASALGLVAGGDIMIHGLPAGSERVGKNHRRVDWTEGCIAVTNEELDEIWSAIPDGAPIQIKP